MTDEVAQTGYDRIVLRGLNVYGVMEDGTETHLFEARNPSHAMEAADYYAYINGVTFQREAE